MEYFISGNTARLSDIGFPQEFSNLKFLDCLRKLIPSSTMKPRIPLFLPLFTFVLDHSTLNCINNTCILIHFVENCRHNFCHTFISLLIKESQRAGDGISIFEVSAIAGHSDPTVTMKIYGGLFPNSTERAMKILDTCNAIKLPALRGKDGKSCA